MKKHGFCTLALALAMGITMASAQNWTKISCGGEFSIGLKSDGSLWGWGSNLNGQLGINSKDSFTKLPTRVVGSNDWADVSAGGYHTLALKKNGTLWAWGDGANGEIGDRATKQVNPAPIQVGTDSDWASISAGLGSSYAIKKSGQAYSWGYDGGYALGDSAGATSIPNHLYGKTLYRQIASGGVSVAAIAANGSLWTWGTGAAGALGNGSTANQTIPKQVGTDSDWKQMACGFEFVFGLKNNGKLWSWGLGNEGELGQDSSNISTNVPAQVGTDSDWAFVAAGSAFAFALKKDGSLYAWGDNTVGELGINARSPAIFSPTRVDNSNAWTYISGAMAIVLQGQLFGLHAIGLKSDYDGYCGAGTNYIYQLGSGDTSTSPAFNCTLGLKSALEAANQNPLQASVFPNPFEGIAHIGYTLAQRCDVNVSVYDLTGKQVAILKNGPCEAGQYLDAFDATQSHCPPGLYLIKLIAGNQQFTSRVEVER